MFFFVQYIRVKNPIRNFKLRLFLIFVFTFLAISIATSQEKKDKKIESSLDLKLVPYIGYNRTYEFMFGAVPMMMYKVNKKDSISPKSLSGAMGVYTTNKSWFTVLFSQLYLDEDRWRVIFAAGLGNINAQFLQSGGVNDFIDYQTGANFLKLEVKRRIGKGLYLGGNYLYTQFDNRFDTAIPIETEETLNGLGATFLWDKRDDVYYPTQGHKFNIQYTSYAAFLGNEDESNEIRLTYNKYISNKNSNNTWAFRAFGGFGIGDVVFNKLIVMGGTDLRGYTQGEFRGKQLIAAQAEYRYNFKPKMGLVAFGGFGSVFQSNIESNNGKILPSIGVGYRYLVFPKNKMRVGIDVAAGKNDWGVYFRIGESF